MNLETIFVLLACVLVFGLLLYAFTRARQKHALELRKLETEEKLAALEAQDARDARAAIAARGRSGERTLRVVRDEKKAAGKCASCVHFDHELGQKELASHPPAVAAHAHVPPWRTGRVLKRDAEGNALPLDEQGVSKEMAALRWDEMGACVEHQEIRAPFDTCPEYECADRTGAA